MAGVTHYSMQNQHSRSRKIKSCCTMQEKHLLCHAACQHITEYAKILEIFCTSSKYLFLRSRHTIHLTF